MNDEVLLKLIEMVESASPVIWDAALRHVYVVVVADLIWGIILLGSAYAVYRFARRMWDEWDNDDPQIISVIVIALLVLFGALVITSGLMWLGSPEYAAIRFLLR